MAVQGESRFDFFRTLQQNQAHAEISLKGDRNGDGVGVAMGGKNYGYGGLRGK